MALTPYCFQPVAPADPVPATADKPAATKAAKPAKAKK